MLKERGYFYDAEICGGNSGKSGNGKDLNWLFELRGVGDYGATVHVSQQDAEKAIRAAEGFVQAIEALIQKETE
jgi:uncharacterized protein (UPF0332 family)